MLRQHATRTMTTNKYHYYYERYFQVGVTMVGVPKHCTPRGGGGTVAAVWSAIVRVSASQRKLVLGRVTFMDDRIPDPHSYFWKARMTL